MVGTSFAVVAHLPPEYITALMSGQGVAGVFVGGLKLVFNYWVFTEKGTIHFYFNLLSLSYQPCPSGD